VSAVWIGQQRCMRKEDVIEVIRSAFVRTTRPSTADFVHCEQCEIFLTRFLESCPAKWDEIPPDDISHESSALTAVTPLGWQFLLPAYMIWDLENYNQRTDSNTVENVVWNLTWDDNKDEHIAAGFLMLSPEQVRAVDAFLAFIAGQNDDPILAADAAKARESYWKRAAA
jgi:hypothetical protein